MTFKPLLASPVDLDKLKFPVMVSPKMDGIRAINMSGVGLVSRNIKAIPNNHVRDIAYRLFPIGFDGELLTYTDGKVDDFSTVSSKIMSRDGAPDFKFHVFDNYEMNTAPFSERIYNVARDVQGLRRQMSKAVDYLDDVEHHRVMCLEELMDYEEQKLAERWEGIMLRDPNGIYKFGRSTANEGILLKMKRFFDAEAKIVDFVEREINNNEQTRDNLGRAKRSTAKAGKVPAGDLGALVVEVAAGTELNGVTLEQPVRFELGTGFTASQRVGFWGSRAYLLDRVVKFKAQELSKDTIPRFPVFMGLRHPDDL